MTRIGCCLVPDHAPPPQASFDALRSELGVSMCRFTPSLSTLFPAPGVADFSVADVYVDRLNAAHIEVYLNPSNIPAHASNGVAAFVPGVGGSAAWWLAQQAHLPEESIAAIFDRAAELDDPEAALRQLEPAAATPSNIFHFAKNYRDEQGRTWCWNDPLNAAAGIHVYGDPQHADADRVSAPRPWCANADLVPHVDAAFMRAAGRQIGEHFGRDRVTFHGWGNEFGNADCWLPIRFDGANAAGGEDTMRTRAFPEMVVPYTEGLRSVQPDAKFIASEADGADILRRYCEVETEVFGTPPSSLLSFHPYGQGDGFPDGSYKKIETEYLPIVQAHGKGRPYLFSEISDEGTGRFAEWLAEAVRRYKPWAVFALREEWDQWFRDWLHGDVTLTAKGEAVKPVTRAITKRRRPVLHP